MNKHGRKLKCSLGEDCPRLKSKIIELKIVTEGKSHKHTVTETEIIIVMNGDIHLYDGIKDSIHIAAGTMFLLPQGWRVVVESHNNAQLFICRIGEKTDLCHTLGFFGNESGKGDSRVVTLPVNQMIENYLKDFITFYEDQQHCDYYFGIKTEELLYCLKFSFDMKTINELFAIVAFTESDFRNYILSSLRKDITSYELFMNSNMSRAVFDSKFRKVMGDSPKCFVDKYKSRRIYADLAGSSKTSKELAAEYGFATENVFIRFCIRNLGASPRKIRDSYRIAENNGNGERYASVNGNIIVEQTVLKTSTGNGINA